MTGYCGACQANEHDHCLDDPNLDQTRQPCDCPPCHTTHGDPFLSPWQTNPTAGTSEDAAAQLDMARDLDRALKARDEDDSGNRHTLDEVVEELGIDESDDEGTITNG